MKYFILIFLCSLDHTYGTGFGNYLHMDGSDMQSGQRAILRSPLIDGQVHPEVNVINITASDDVSDLS